MVWELVNGVLNDLHYSEISSIDQQRMESSTDGKEKQIHKHKSPDNTLGLEISFQHCEYNKTLEGKINHIVWFEHNVLHS